MTDLLLFSFKSIMRKKLRTMLTAISVGIGITSVIIISSIGEFGQTAVDKEINSLGLGSIAVSCNSNFLEQGSIAGDREKIIVNNENVETAMPIYMISTSVTMRNNTTNCVIFGVDERASEIVPSELLHGRSISAEDVASGANVCIIDSEFANKSYRRTNVVGKKVYTVIGHTFEEFTVIGVIKTGTGLVGSFAGSYMPSFIFIPSAAISNITHRDDFDSIVVKLKPEADADSVSRELVRDLKLRSENGEQYSAENLSKQRKSLDRIMKLMTEILAAVGTISLIVAGIGITTVMTMSVSERTREIGIKKSVGASRSDIITEFIFEAVEITLLGCIAGVLLSYLITAAANVLIGVNIVIRLSSVLKYGMFSLLIGIIFGAYPAFKAAGLDPIDALRHD